MTKRTNPKAWGLVSLTGILLLVGGWVLVGWALPAFLGLPPGQYLVGMRAGSRWHVGPSIAELGGGRVLDVGPVEVYIGPRLDH